MICIVLVLGIVGKVVPVVLFDSPQVSGVKAPRPTIAAEKGSDTRPDCSCGFGCLSVGSGAWILDKLDDMARWH